MTGLERKAAALAEFKRMLRWIACIGVVMSVGAIVYLWQTGELFLHMVVATLGGVFVSVLLGCGLFAAAFFSDKSGHDEAATLRRPSGINQTDE